eukprot:TRINITY_DN15648_c0_g1_i1.p2 TRINITY_DN15648_c0_g1~~TRINITY_DN15648_c0_g1_i1.p2  ORF type:complete len:102 (+),score=0.96 TRINITY_DN15648_c0_g1_i1:406-711(+)
MSLFNSRKKKVYYFIWHPFIDKTSSGLFLHAALKRVPNADRCLSTSLSKSSSGGPPSCCPGVAAASWRRSRLPEECSTPCDYPKVVLELSRYVPSRQGSDL